MIALTMTALVLAVILSLSIGIAAGYYAIVGILYALAPAREDRRVATQLIPIKTA